MWHQSSLAQLVQTPVCGYAAGDAAAAEPTALAGLALSAYRQAEPARQAAEWLAATQARDGSVPVRPDLDGPRWPTSLAILAWQEIDRDGFRGQIKRAVGWTLSMRGKTQPKSSEVFHDPSLTAWPWVAGTHAWIEPTALHVLALKATGHSAHPRVREAVRMLVDRQIPGGGCNYGNTGVLGQKLWPHVQPTGLALWALAGETMGRGRIDASLVWLKRALNESTTSMSLAWGLLGLRAHSETGRDLVPPAAPQWIERAAVRNGHGTGSAYKSALLLLAANALAEPASNEVAPGTKR